MHNASVTLELVQLLNAIASDPRGRSYLLTPGSAALTVLHQVLITSEKCTRPKHAGTLLSLFRLIYSPCIMHEIALATLPFASVRRFLRYFCYKLGHACSASWPGNAFELSRTVVMPYLILGVADWHRVV